MKLAICVLITAALFLIGCASGDQSKNAQSGEEQADALSSGAAENEAVPLVGSCTPNLEASASDEEAITNVLHGEGKFVVAQDIDTLMSLWSGDSVIADAKNTPNNKEDDQVWQDKDAIRHRYVRIVFPGAPSVAQPSNLDIAIDGDEAVVMATTNIGDEISPHGDEWRLVNQEGCWLIKSLTYNLEEK